MVNLAPRVNRVPLVKKVKQEKGVNLEMWDCLAQRDLWGALGSQA